MFSSLRGFHPGFLLPILLLSACASGPVSAGVIDDAALRAYAASDFNKAALMHTTVALGRHHGQPVVAEFPCSDVCPQYTVRIIHYQLADGVSCASVGGVEKEILVPVAITVRLKTFCVPKAIAGEMTAPKR
ncbi:hypothetical protein PY254_05330 [Rhodanobacter sp. AS-Z3]|uniref:hypothetical protein n=1 Tax=Rhodanobacter sp. AS-Z3 TaxID=3031330 RepID=UPI0024799561|nr:hypothetical protein [Rhodanobacter sp. AS-Z3]WEN16095.1 hypothetical protein PY254_05330 [Rhodanobacter sp. AS-Z3]